MFFVQLLCSVHKYALLKKKKIEILKPLPESLKTILEDFGFFRDKGCIKEVEENLTKWKNLERYLKRKLMNY